MSMTIKPFQTLLFDEKEQYPGLVGADRGTYYDLVWYKWGYNSPDGILKGFVFKKTALESDALLPYIVDAAHPFFRRHGLPPEYKKDTRREDITRELQSRIACILADAETGDQNAVEMNMQYLTDYVMELLDDA